MPPAGPEPATLWLEATRYPIAPRGHTYFHNYLLIQQNAVI